MSRYRKLTTICAAVVLSLGLAACGGGGGSNLADQQQNTVDYGKAVTEARAAAKVSYMAAETDATSAETAADAAEATASGTPDATAARAAATAARTAADAAKAAHDAIEDGKTKAAADAATAQAEKAADEAANANTAYMTAKAKNDAIQTAKAITDEQNRKRDVAAATSAASSAAMAARTAANEARTAATNARNAANDARDSYMAAMAARTDSTDAKAQYDAADAAATAAETAATTAEAAATAAEAAHAGIDANGSGADAQAAQGIAETKKGEAETASGTASTQLAAATTAKDKAGTSAGTHVLGLLKAANDTGETNATTRAATIKAVADRMARAPVRAASGNRVDTRGTGNASVTATWNANTPANPDNTPPLKEVVMYPSVTVSGIVGEAVTSETRATRVAKDLNGDGDTGDPGEAAVTNNAKRIDGLAGLPGSYGFDITAGDRHIIVFTDIEQQKGAVPAVTLKDAVSLNGVPAVMSRVVLADNATTLTGASYDHDGDKDTNALTGDNILSCPTGVQCSFEISGGKLTSLVGYVVTVSADAGFVLKAPQEAVADNTYLAFGVWMDEGASDTTPEMGAFYNSGTTGEGLSIVNADIDNVTGDGDATYRGAAMGLYTRGKAKETNRSVDYFHGNATLTAKFGAADENGMISGTIDGIMAGGTATGDVITLRGAQGDNTGAPNENAINDMAAISDTASFAGIATMGASKTVNGVETYVYKGNWSGSFFNAGKEPDPDPSDAIDVAPTAVSGAFGVTGTDNMGTTTGDNATADDVTTTYVGAFGAHKQ